MVDPTGTERLASLASFRDLARLVGAEAEALRPLFEDCPPAALPPGLGDLLRQPPGRQLTVLRNVPRLRTPGNVDLLLDVAFDARHSSPLLGLLLASLALTLATELDSGACPPDKLADCVARAAGCAGNSLRILLVRVDAADAILSRAREAAKLGTGDWRLEYSLLSFTASLRSTQLRFDEAIAILRGMLRLQLLGSDFHHAGRTLVSLGMAYGHRCDVKSALVCFCRAARLLDREADPLLYAGCVHNLAWWSLEAGLLSQAQAFRDLLAQSVPSDYGRLQWLRLQWLDARLAAGSGRRAEAIDQLLEVREEWRREQMPYEYALASLDLATLYHQAGQDREVASLAADILPLLSSREDAIGALDRLRTAALSDQLSSRLLTGVARTLRRSGLSAVAR